MLNIAGKMAKGVALKSVFRPETVLAVEVMVRVALVVCTVAEAVSETLKEGKSPWSS